MSTENHDRARVPGKGNATVYRPRLIDLLHSRLGLRLQAVSAPAGYGKTTLLADFARSLDVPVCWYSLDRTDGDPRLLLEGILASVRTQFPQSCDRTEARLSRLTDSSRDGLALVNSLTGEMSATIPDYFVVILEDYHFIEDSDAARSLLSSFLERCPENCHVILSSRTQVDLPAFSKLRFQNLAELLTASELSLTPSEIQHVVSARYGLTLPDPEAASLARDTGGWPIGVLLAAARARDGKAPGPSCGVSESDVFRYLASEVLDRQDAGVRDFLLATSTLEELTPAAVGQLVPSRNPLAMLGLLEKQNLFLQRIGEDQKRYRYHHLFRDFLQARLREGDPARYDFLHMKAGLIYEFEQRWTEAVAQYLAAGRYDDVARIVKAVGDTFHRSGKWATVRRWLDALPGSLKETDPELELLDAQTMVHMGRPEEAVHTLAAVLTRCDGIEPVVKAKAFSLRSAAFRLTGHYEQARADIELAITLLQQKGGAPDLLGDAYRRLANIHAEQGRFPEALADLERALECFTSILAVNEIAAVHNSFGIVYRRLGQMTRAVTHYNKAREGWSRTKNYGELATAMNNVGFIYHRLGQHDLALDSFRSALDSAREAGYRRVEAGVLVSIADVLRDSGSYHESLDYYQQGIELARELAEAAFVAYANAGIGETYRLLGRPDKAEVLIKEAVLQAEAQKQRYEAAVFSVRLGIIEYQRGQHDEAEKTLSCAAETLGAIEEKDALAGACFHLAQTAFLRREFDAALGWLKRVSDLCDELGYDGFLTVEGRNSVPLLQYAASKHVGGDRFARTLERLRSDEKGKTAAGNGHGDMPAGIATRPDIEVRTLGETRVVVGGRSVTDADWRSSRAKELFFYLLAHGGRTREQVLAALWPDMSPARGVGNFHINLLRARRALFPTVFAVENARYSINPDLVLRSDVIEFEGSLTAAEALPDDDNERTRLLEEAFSLYGGPFVPEIYSDWAETRRRQLESGYLKVLLLLADHYERAGVRRRAASVLERAITVDPYREDLYCRLVRSHLAEQDNPLALQVYRRFMAVVAEDQTIQTSSEMQELYQRILTTNSPR